MTRPLQTHCLNGHLRTSDTIYKSGNCKKCNLDQVRNRWINDPKYREKKLNESRMYQKSDKWKESSFKRKYGITLSDYKEALSIQENRCAICFTHASILTRPLNVDHDHKTNIVRGLLCCNCNTALGLLKDNSLVLKMAINYLEKERV